MGTPRYALALY